MKYKLLIAAVALGVTGAAVVGGITSALADEAAIEADIGELRGAILSFLRASGCHSDGNEPKLQERRGARACGPSHAGRRGTGQATTEH